jgi:hypothetical protein
MRILNNSMNFQPLKDAVQHAKKEILICSAWIRGEVLRNLFPLEIREKIQNNEINLKIITRIGERKDIEISGTGLFEFVNELGSGCEIRYHKTLHTKMYIIDDSYAQIGSFNLTGSGFGTDEKPGRNIESGIEYTDPAEIQPLRDEFFNIWEQEAIPIDNSLIGFVMSGATEREFYMIGIHPPESGMFVVVKDNQNGREEYILGQITKVYQFNPDFYAFTEEGELFNENMINAFGNSNPFVNQMAGIAEKQTGYGKNLHFAKISVKSRVYHDENGQFKREVNRYAPVVAGEVVRAQKEILETIYTHPDCRPAVLLSNPEVEAGLDPEKILTMHMAIFGSTGSGKSYFTKQLIKHYLKPWMEKQNGRIIILDPHGEYASGKDFVDVLSAGNIIPKKDDESLNTLETKVVEDVDDLIEVCELGKLNRKQKDYLQKTLLKAKGDTGKFKKLLEEDFENTIKNEGLEIDWYKYYQQDMEEIFVHEITPLKKMASVKADIAKANGDTRTKGIIEVEKLNELFLNLPEEERKKIRNTVIQKYLKDFERQFMQKIEPELPKELIDMILEAIENKTFRLESYNFIDKVKEPGIYCIDMRTIHDADQRLELAGDILRGAFHLAKEKDFKTLFVVEEAHNFAPEKGSKSNPAYKYMVKIAREGRKFGVGLIVVSQRPAYVSKDVLAQCNSQAIFRLINPNDLNAVEATVEGISKEELFKLPNYELGQCIFTGVAIQEPVVVKVKP